MKTRTYKVYWTDDNRCVINHLQHFCNSNGDYVDGAFGILHYIDYKDAGLRENVFGLYYSYRRVPDEDGIIQMEFYPAYDDAGNHILIEDDKVYEAPYVYGSSTYDRELKSMICKLKFEY